MCRYGLHVYKSKFVCFSCRKCFHKTAWADFVDREPDGGPALRIRPGETPEERDERRALHLVLSERYRRTVGRCPDCGAQMEDLGHDFRPPRRRDIAAWRAVEQAHELGHLFLGCGCYGPGFVPSSRAEYRSYLRERRTQFQREYEEAQSIAERDLRLDRCAYWADRLQLIEAAIASV